MKIIVEMDIPDWFFKELEDRRGFDRRPTPREMLDEIQNAIEQRFGGSMKMVSPSPLLQDAHDVIVRCIGPLDWGTGGTYEASTNVYGETRRALAECISIHGRLHEPLEGCCPPDEDT